MFRMSPLAFAKGMAGGFFLFLAASLFSASQASASSVSGLKVETVEGEIVVSAALRLDSSKMKDIEDGISKEITFYVDLFRIWDRWPDEFVTGKTFVRTLKCDPVKKQYLATSFDGATLVQKRFGGCASLAKWALGVEGVRLASETELEASKYFVRVTVESRLRRLPPVINHFFFFVKEKEFSVSGDSDVFSSGGGR